MSVKSIFISAATMLAMAPLHANAHMILTSPSPFGNPNNSPLDASGSDFPCKAVPYTINSMNNWEVGSTQTLSFTGTAVHGGGSCQMSVTTDKEPTKESKWKVIYSIEGGCPVSAEGNLDQTGPSLDNSFKFTIPPELPNGVMTTAWTWFNKIGNREMYMNCAPITVSGGADDTTAFEALPDMAVANIGVPSSCGKTTESSDFTFENPGKYVMSAGKGPFVDLCTGKTSQPNTGGGGGSGNVDAGPSAANPAPAPSASPPAAAPSAANPPAAPPAFPSAAMPSSPAGTAPANPPAAPSASASPTKSACPAKTEPTLRTIVTVTASTPLGIFPPGSASGTGTAPAPVPAPLPTDQSPASPVAPQPEPSAAPAPAPAPVSPIAGKEPCSPDGAIICSPDGMKFGICNFGKAIMMDVAAGTTCTDGAIAKRGDYSHRIQRTAV